MKREDLTIGRIVHYVPSSAGFAPQAQDCVPALIIRIDDPREDMITLAAFRPNSELIEPHAFAMRDDRARKVGSWHWPRECDDVQAAERGEARRPTASKTIRRPTAPRKAVRHPAKAAAVKSRSTARKQGTPARGGRRG